MEITKVIKPFIKRGWPNTFGNIVYIYIDTYINMDFAFVEWMIYIYSRQYTMFTAQYSIKWASGAFWS